MSGFDADDKTAVKIAISSRVRIKDLISIDIEAVTIIKQNLRLIVGIELLFISIKCWA